MAATVTKFTHLPSQWSGLRRATRGKNAGFVCGQCQRQKERRRFHNSAPSWLRNNARGINAKDAGVKSHGFSVAELEPEERAEYEALSPSNQQIYRDDHKQIQDILNSPEAVAEFRDLTGQAIARGERDAPVIQKNRQRALPGFWNKGLGPGKTELLGEEDQYKGDDLTEMGHAELEQHREMREYARIAAWEMPLLSKLATAFKPPDMDHVLRFRYTTYMGEDHPAATKIVLEFCPSDLPDLTPAQRTKLIKLVGVRYDPENDLVKMSSEMFETQAQNKRYLGDLVDTLMAEARNAADMFEDVPLDFRHHRFKKKLEYPEDWKMTPERKMQLEEGRRAREQIEQERVDAGRLVDGGVILKQAMAAMAGKQESRVAVPQQRGGAKKGGAKRTLR